MGWSSKHSTMDPPVLSQSPRSRALITTPSLNDSLCDAKHCHGLCRESEDTGWSHGIDTIKPAWTVDAYGKYVGKYVGKYSSKYTSPMYPMGDRFLPQNCL